MGCLSENTIQELVDGALSVDARAHAHRHIDGCAQCRALVIELARDGDGEATVAASVPAVAAQPHLLAGRFELVRPLGRGGMGIVYEALDHERGIRVALKTLQHVSADSLLRFKTEFRAVQDVHHANLVTLHDLIEDRGAWWLTMELVDGVGLLRHVRPGGQLDEHRLRAALPQLAAGLSALHGHGLVHRDVKPHNVLVTGAGRVVLLDFGLVAVTTQSESNVVGTPAYMAPEQGLLTEIGPAADWYGVGALLYEALTGVLPFTGSPLQILVAKQHELPRRPGEQARVTDDLDALCMQLLAIDPAARLAAVPAVAALDRSAVPRSSPPPRSSAPAFVGRTRELAGLAEAFAATRGGAEAIVLVEGESGIGKSALVHHFLDELQRRQPDVRILAGRCYERETVPYKGVDGVIDALARCLRKLPEPEVSAVLPRRAALLRHAFPVLAKVPALAALATDDVVDRVELRFRVFTALRELLGRLAERGPLVAWIDDLQWADADSLELLTWVMARPEAPPLLLLLTSRPHPVDEASTAGTTARIRALPGLRVLPLTPLTRDEALALVDQLVAEAAPSCTLSTRLLVDEAAGHPLFLETLVRHGAMQSALGCSLRLSDALWARVEEVDASARELLALIAVAGSPVSLEILRASTTLPADELPPALARLRGAHLTRAVDRSDRSVEPYHDRVREAVLEHLDPELRKTCHRALAHALMRRIAPADVPADARVPVASASSSGADWGPEAVAVHLQAAGDVEQAARYLVRAADQAAMALAFDRAARLYREALAIDRQTGALNGDARDARTHLAQALVSASRAREAAEVYFELARDAAARGEDALALRLRGVEQLQRSGEREAGRRELAALLDDLELSPPASRAGALWRLVRRRAWVRLRGIGAFLPAGPIPAREMSPRERLRLDACWIAATSNDLAPEYLTRYQVLALQAADLRSRCMALVVESAITAMSRARRHARVMKALAAAVARCGDPYVLAQEQYARSVTALAEGQWSRGRDHAAQAMQIYRDSCIGAAIEHTIAAACYFQCQQHLGEYRVLMREIQPLLREAEERDDHFSVAYLHAGELRAIWRDDQPALARQQVDRAMASWTAGDHDLMQLMAQFSRASIELYEGDGAAAYRRLDLAVRPWLRLPVARLTFVGRRAFGLRGLAALAAYRLDRRDRRLLRCAARDARALRAMREPWTGAVAGLLEAGVAVAGGMRDRARAHLEHANADFLASSMPLHAAVARRRIGELQGGADGARMVEEADALLAAQDIGAPERFARLFAPEC